MNMQVCNRCIMDTNDPNIRFNGDGFCNHCREYYEVESANVFQGEEGRRRLERVIARIRAKNRGKKYDCVLGISGGADSSYTAFCADKLGLRVLLTHLDNEFDAPEATHNIQKIIENTGFDFYECKADMEEFIDLWVAHLKASVIDIEVVSDHAITASVYKVSDMHDTKFLLTGSNVVTETIMPKAWGYRKNDLPNIKDIHKKHGRVKLKTFPTAGILKLAYYRFFKGIQTLAPLNYLDYNRDEARNILQKEWRWKDYGMKHWESILTRFYQGYILPRKFGIDKRRAHLSNMICSGQTTREEALAELMKPPYPEDKLEKDKKFVLNKLGLSNEEFEEIMKSPIRSHQDYASDEWLYSLLKPFKRLLRMM